MPRTIAAVLLALSLGGCAQRYTPSEPQPGYPLESDIASAYGIEYRATLNRAWQGSETDLRLCFLISLTTDGCYSEAHSERLRELLEHLGDGRFAGVLQGCGPTVRNVVAGHLLHAYGLDDGSERQVFTWFRDEYPFVTAACKVQIEDYMATGR